MKNYYQTIFLYCIRNCIVEMYDHIQDLGAHLRSNKRFLYINESERTCVFAFI